MAEEINRAKHVNCGPWFPPHATSYTTNGVYMRHQLIGLLGRHIKRQPMIDILVHREDHLGIRTVYRTRRDVRKMVDTVGPIAFESSDESNDITVDLGERILMEYRTPT
jgi:hypothetical protein